MQITPAPLSGSLQAPPSKSQAHRMAICAALADRPTRIALEQTNQDIEATLSGLAALGAGIERQPGAVIITPGPAPQHAVVDCRESGSTLRFLLPVAAQMGVCARFTGCGRLPERPIGPLAGALCAHGCRMDSPHLPLQLCGRLTAGDYVLPGNISSQFITGLLFALPVLEGDSTLTLSGTLESRGYVDMTLAALAAFGIRVQSLGNTLRVPGGQRYTSPGSLAIEGDWSGAAAFLASGALAGPVTVTGLDTASPQGDRAIAPLLERFGARVERVAGGVRVCSRGALHGCDIDCTDFPDLVPVLAAGACLAGGCTHLTGAARLRLKESDRLETTSAMLSALGADISQTPDGLAIWGKPSLPGGAAQSFGDHRIAMACALASIGCTGGVTLEGAGAVKKSYPAFFEDFKRLGGNADGL
nr:3-phosphoshikimate 1-carboxyvinyltransferase [bacterium]